MKIAYFDCFAGAGGDMIAAAMLDAGLDEEFLRAQLATLNLENLDIEIAETNKHGIRALRFKPVFPHQHHHRSLGQITKIINESKISPPARGTAIAIFEKLAHAEAAIHNKNPEDIHFHEVGAIDSIVDIVSAAIGAEALGIDKIYCSDLAVGGGTVKCAHGLLPVPAPATAELLKDVPIVGGPGQVELLTPTAAAILTTIVDEFTALPAMKIETIGYGAGTLDSDEFPNVLRLIIGESLAAEELTADSVCLLETNVDDVSAELIGFAIDELGKAGALDVWTMPIFMKRNRPAVKISVLCEIKDVRRAEQILFEQGLTFGIRKQILQRSKLARKFVTVSTDFGEIKMKVGSRDGMVVNVKPEFSDCITAAAKHNVPVKIVRDAAMSAYRRNK